MKKVCFDTYKNCTCIHCIHGDELMPAGGLPCCVRHEISCAGGECVDFVADKREPDKLDDSLIDQLFCGRGRRHR